MKLRRIGTTALAVLLILSGCGKSAVPTEKETSDSLETTQMQKNQETADSNESATEPKATANEPQESALPAENVVKIYRGDENAEFILPYEEDFDVVTGGALVECLIQYQVLDSTVKLNQMREDEKKKQKILYLDFNQSFQEQLESSGSAAEWCMIGSLVNTFLEAFSADQLYITVEGEVPVSGNIIYDEALTKYEAGPETFVEKAILINGKKKKIELSRVCVSSGFALNFAYEKIKLSFEEKTEVLELHSQKKAEGRPVAVLSLQPSDRSLEEEAKELKTSLEASGEKVVREEISIGEENQLAAIRISPETSEDSQTCYYIAECGGRTWKLELSYQNETWQKYLQLTVDSLKYIR